MAYLTALFFTSRDRIASVLRTLGSGWSHVGLTDGEVAFVPGPDPRWWWSAEGVARVPSLRLTMRIEVSPAFDLEEWASGRVRPEPFWRMALHRRDCVQTAREAFAAAGVPLGWAATPAGLYDRLREAGATIRTPGEASYDQEAK